ncbi:hypothetical protein BBJ28_00015974 [Nothophytophthora sp. Chile5]|nr:hypothetical protein BBJ28_00015974 [Nothophytophthora sp. Chile5]
MTDRSGDGPCAGGAGSNVLALGVRGYACQVFDEPAAAWALHQETHLIPWRGESRDSLRVDRFDARNLLEDKTLFRQLKKKPRTTGNSVSTSATWTGSDAAAPASTPGGDGDVRDSEETEQQMLHRLRFGDYAMEFSPREEAAAENKFPYVYPEDQSDEESDGEAFEPLWAVPNHLQLAQHAILAATANKVRGRPQLEVMLKVSDAVIVCQWLGFPRSPTGFRCECMQVKLSANAKFRFLDASHALHGYYCFLRDENPQPPATKTKVSLLGEEYDQDVSACVLVEGWLSGEDEEQKHEESGHDEGEAVDSRDEELRLKAIRLRRHDPLTNHAALAKKPSDAAAEVVEDIAAQSSSKKRSRGQSDSEQTTNRRPRV